jgi:hypothetical protein
MNHASGTIAPLDPELIQVGDAIGQRAQRSGLVQGSETSRRITDLFFDGIRAC